jgi:hypothetical protein
MGAITTDPRLVTVRTEAAALSVRKLGGQLTGSTADHAYGTVSSCGTALSGGHTTNSTPTTYQKLNTKVRATSNSKPYLPYGLPYAPTAEPEHTIYLHNSYRVPLCAHHARTQSGGQY